MAPSGTASKLKVIVYTIVIKILLYQFRFKLDAIQFHKLSICFYSVEDYMIHLISAWIDQEQ
jgi:hypothetical protein